MADVRRALADDAAEIARLTTELGYKASLSEISARLSVLMEVPGHFVAVAEVRSGSLAGWVAAERRLILESGQKAEITGLVVDRTQRRFGIGGSLVRAVEQWATQYGLTSLVIRTNIDRPEAHSFYLSAGYSRSKTQHVYSKSIPADPEKGTPRQMERT